MHFNFIGQKKMTDTVSGLEPRGSGKGQPKGKAANQWEDEPRRRTEAMPSGQEDDWARLEELSSKRRMTILTEELERQTRAQSQFEESFYKMAVRLQSSGEMVEPGGIAGATKRNLLTRRLETERGRLVYLTADMGEVIERMKLISMHMKVIRFRPSEEALQVRRDECVIAIQDFVLRSERSVLHARDLTRAIRAHQSALGAAVKAARPDDR